MESVWFGLLDLKTIKGFPKKKENNTELFRAFEDQRIQVCFENVDAIKREKKAGQIGKNNLQYDLVGF